MPEPTRLFLHVGTPKTGTTAIQGFLNANTQLLDEAAVNFVAAAKGPSAHNFLAVRGRQPDMAQKLLQDIEGEVLSKPAHRHVISGEMLFAPGWPRLYARHWSPELIRDTKVVIYLRRQDKYLEALYKQHLKVGRFFGSPQEYREKQSHRLHYLPTIEAYAQAFGEENVIITPYERNQFPDGDVVQHFAQTIGIEDLDLSALAEKEANVTMSREVSEFLGVVHTSAKINMVPLLRTLIAADEPGVARSNDCYVVSEQREIVAAFAEETEAIRQRFCPHIATFFDTKNLDPSISDTPVSDTERLARVKAAQVSVCRAIAENYRVRPVPPRSDIGAGT